MKNQREKDIGIALGGSPVGSSSPSGNATHDIKKLPLWAQELIDKLRSDNSNLKDRIKTMEEMSGIFDDSKCHWYKLNYNNQLTKDGFEGLWVFSKNHPVRLFSIYEGDRIFIGRKANNANEQTIL